MKYLFLLSFLSVLMFVPLFSAVAQKGSYFNGAPKGGPVDEDVSPERRRLDQISKAARLHGGRVAGACLNKWEEQSCLRQVSDTYLTAVSLYAEDLEVGGFKAEQEPLKEHCAASTAATQLDDVPAYAMRSAFVECSNKIYAIYERTKIMPDQELGQLMVLAVLCLDKDPRCSQMEEGLAKTMGLK